MTHQSRDRFVWCHNSSAWWAGEERGHLGFRSPSFPALFGGLGEGTPPGIEKQKWHVTQVSHAIYRREKTLLPLVGFSYSWVTINTSWRAELQTIWYTLFSPSNSKEKQKSKAKSTLDNVFLPTWEVIWYSMNGKRTCKSHKNKQHWAYYSQTQSPQDCRSVRTIPRPTKQRIPGNKFVNLQECIYRLHWVQHLSKEVAAKNKQ